KELFYGLLFGLGAVLIDVFMHTSMDRQDFWTDLIRPEPMMLGYRIFFVCFGLFLGWLLWRKNKTERDFRRQAVDRLQRNVSQHSLLIHTKMQVLLTRADLHLPSDAEELIRFAYEKSRELGGLANERLTNGGTG